MIKIQKFTPPTTSINSWRKKQVFLDAVNFHSHTALSALTLRSGSSEDIQNVNVLLQQSPNGELSGIHPNTCWPYRNRL